jgi:hypothetical protein
MTTKIPKTRQVYFFMMPEDTICTIQFMIDEKYKLFNARSCSNIPTEITNISTLSQIYLCPYDLTRDIVMNKIANKVFVIDANISPVIEFECSMIYPNALSRGRMYFRNGYLGRDKYFFFPDSLYICFENIYKFMNKRLFIKERRYSAYMTYNSLMYVNSGGKLTQV